MSELFEERSHPLVVTLSLSSVCFKKNYFLRFEHFVNILCDFFPAAAINVIFIKFLNDFYQDFIWFSYDIFNWKNFIFFFFSSVKYRFEVMSTEKHENTTVTSIEHFLATNTGLRTNNIPPKNVDHREGREFYILYFVFILDILCL